MNTTKKTKQQVLDYYDEIDRKRERARSREEERDRKEQNRLRVRHSQRRR